MRFGLSTSPQLTTFDWLREIWQLADELPVFESAWTFDHLYPLQQPNGACYDGWITLTALLHATNRLRGGVLVSGVVYRHPALLAKMTVTLDAITDGRLDLGLGAGWYELESEAFGFSLGSPADRFDRLEEALTIVTSLLAGDTVTFAGRWFRLNDALCRPTPHHQIPICIGGKGIRRTIPLVAEYAQHWNYSGTDPVEFVRCRDALQKACDAIGRDFTTITCSVELRSIDRAELLRDIQAFEHAGASLGLIEIPKNASPSVVTTLAALLEAQ